MKRLKKAGDLFAPVLSSKQRLRKQVLNGTSPPIAQRSKRRRLAVQVTQILAELPRQPADFIEPMQPESVTTLPASPDWQYEAKWDGYRAIAVKNGDRVVIYSRN